MTGIVLPDWARNLTETDRANFSERLRRLPAKDHEREHEDYLNLAEDPAYRIVKAVVYERTQDRLEEKPICLPNIPCDDDRIREAWAQNEEGGTGTWGELFADVEQSYDEEWIEGVRAFEANPRDLYNAHYFLDHHPAFWQVDGDHTQTPQERIHHRNMQRNYGITRAVTLDVVKVDPLTGHVEDDRSLNTQTQIWVEMGQWEWPSSTPVDEHSKRDAHFHDPKLDCGADTMDLAIIVAAITLHTFYGNDRIICDNLDGIERDGWFSEKQVREIAAWYDTHDAFGNLLPEIEWAHDSVPPEAVQ